MKRQIILGITVISILTSITACSESVPQTQPDNQVSADDSSSPVAEASTTEGDSTPTNNFETGTNITAEKVRGIYGETEIPDIPCGNKDNEGKAHDLDDKEVLKQCLDSMVFETHTCGEYKISLVGDRVRTDKANFPGSIYARYLHVEVEKNGTLIDGYEEDFTGYYCNLLGAALQFTNEFRLFEDKIGSYIDMYELDNPVIAMREFYDNDPERTVKKVVEFATIQNNKLFTDFVGVSDMGTGAILNPDTRDSKPSTTLVLNSEGYTYCRKSIFAADEFKVVDNKTLLDEEAGIKYTFEFSDPPIMELYTAEKVAIDT